MICSRKKSDILVKHMFPAVSLQPHHKRLSKFKADLIINFGPGRVCLSSHFSSQTTCLNLHYRDLGILCFRPILGWSQHYWPLSVQTIRAGFSAVFSLTFLLSSRTTYLNLSHRDLIILCIDLLIVAEDVSQLVVVLVLVLVEDLKVDRLWAEVGEGVVEADLVVTLLLRAKVNRLSQSLSLM